MLKLLAAPAMALLVLAAPQRPVEGLEGAWIEKGKGAQAARLIARHGGLELIENGETTVGRLERGDEGHVYIVDFVNSEPGGGERGAAFHMEGDELVFVLDGEKAKRYERMPPPPVFPRERRDGFSYAAPEGWISNVRVFAPGTGKTPENYDQDQLVRYFELGAEKPAESITLRLEPEPFGKVMEKISEKLENPALASSMENKKIGGRDATVFENKAMAGGSKLSAMVFVIPWGEEKTMVIAAPTLWPEFPDDTRRDIAALIESLRESPEPAAPRGADPR
ncbi:MAG: hypothetical protein ACNS63_00330 [Candidatus Nitrospinota bacterium M3_3B_026]